MKKSMMIALLMTIVIAANARVNREALREARMITDRMAVELRLTDRQYRQVYDINLRHLGNSPVRDRALIRVLTHRQMEKYLRHRHAALRHHSHRTPVTRHHASGRRTYRHGW